MALKKRVRIIKKIRSKPGIWQFISMRKIGNRYVWDKRPGYFFVEWWEGKKQKRALAVRHPVRPARRNAANRTSSLESDSPTAKKSRQLRKVWPLPSRTPSVCSPITFALTRPTNPKHFSATKRSWSTSSGTLGRENSSRRLLVRTWTISRRSVLRRRANNTPVSSPREPSTLKFRCFVHFSNFWRTNGV